LGTGDVGCGAAPTKSAGRPSATRRLVISEAARHFDRRTSSREGDTLSSSSTLANNPEPDTTEATGTEHQHEGQEHEHPHGPVLNPECTRELLIDVPAEEVSAAYSKVAAKYRKLAKIPGFRPGKTPETVIRRRFAADIRKQVIDTLLPERFNLAVREQGVRPVGQPQVLELSIDDGAPFHVKAVFEYLPDFSIDGYQNVTVDKPSAELGEEEFEAEIERQREARAIMEPVEEDRPIQDGDWVQISYKGEIGAEPEAVSQASPEAGAEVPPATKPLTGEDVMVEVGGKDTLPAFTEALRGAKPGQELKAEVMYPADYSEVELAGKSAAFDIEVKAIKKRILPELDDAFAKEMAYEDLAEFKNYVRNRMQERKTRNVKSETEERLFAALAGRFTFPVPESLVQEQIDSRLDRGLRALAAQGMEPSQMRKLDFTRLRAAQRESALAEVKARLLLDRIAHVENITVSDEEVDHELQLISVRTREPMDALKVRLTQDGGLARIREQLLRDKTASVLYERLPG
jgi:trigger factor